MSKLARLAAFSVSLAMLVSFACDEVLAQKKKKDATPKDIGNPAEPADYKALASQKEIAGTVTSVGGGSTTIAFRVDIPRWEPNPNYKPPTNPKGGTTNPTANHQAQLMRTYQDLMRQQQLAMRAKNPQEQQRALQRIQQDMLKLQIEFQKLYAPPVSKTAKGAKVDPNSAPFRMVTTSKDFELEIQDNVVVRKMFLPFEYDDTGSVKQYSEKEKAELRGEDKTKPGYKSKIEEVYAGVEARLILTPPKMKKKADPDKKGEGDDEGVGNVDRPTVSMIILTKDAPTPGIVGADPKKGKKK